MKPFNLEEAKAGKPIVCRDGTPAKFIAHAPEAVVDVERLVFLHEGRIKMGCESGYFISCRSSTNRDLFMAPVKQDVWINIARNRTGLTEVVGTYLTKDDADKWTLGGWFRVACIEVTFEEGQGLS